jgi:hypothetical protein
MSAGVARSFTSHKLTSTREAPADTVGAPDIRATQVLYPMAQKAMGTGMYCPNRQSLLCSQKHCSFLETMRRGVRRRRKVILIASRRA